MLALRCTDAMIPLRSPTLHHTNLCPSLQFTVSSGGDEVFNYWMEIACGGNINNVFGHMCLSLCCLFERLSLAFVMEHEQLIVFPSLTLSPSEKQKRTSICCWKLKALFVAKRNPVQSLTMTGGSIWTVRKWVHNLYLVRPFGKVPFIQYPNWYKGGEGV